MRPVCSSCSKANMFRSDMSTAVRLNPRLLTFTQFQSCENCCQMSCAMEQDGIKDWKANKLRQEFERAFGLE